MEEEIRETNNLRAIYQVDLDVPPIPLEGNNLTSHISPDTEIIPIKKTQKEENTNKLNHSHPLNYIPTQLPTNLIDPSMSIFNTNPNLPSYFPKTLISGNINKPVNYQTEACRNFHSQTGCSHGDNCHFIHDFAFEGRPIPNLEEWRRTNPNRITNLKKMREMQMGAASYYPPHTYFQG